MPKSVAAKPKAIVYGFFHTLVRLNPDNGEITAWNDVWDKIRDVVASETSKKIPAQFAKLPKVTRYRCKNGAGAHLEQTDLNPKDRIHEVLSCLVTGMVMLIKERGEYLFHRLLVEEALGHIKASKSNVMCVVTNSFNDHFIKMMVALGFSIETDKDIRKRLNQLCSQARGCLELIYHFKVKSDKLGQFEEAIIGLFELLAKQDEEFSSLYKAQVWIETREGFLLDPGPGHVIPTYNTDNIYLGSLTEEQEIERYKMGGIYEVLSYTGATPRERRFAAKAFGLSTKIRCPGDPSLNRRRLSEDDWRNTSDRKIAALLTGVERYSVADVVAAVPDDSGNTSRSVGDFLPNWMAVHFSAAYFIANSVMAKLSTDSKAVFNAKPKMLAHLIRQITTRVGRQTLWRDSRHLVCFVELIAMKINNVVRERSLTRDTLIDTLIIEKVKTELEEKYLKPCDAPYAPTIFVTDASVSLILRKSREKRKRKRKGSSPASKAAASSSSAPHRTPFVALRAAASSSSASHRTPFVALRAAASSSSASHRTPFAALRAAASSSSASHRTPFAALRAAASSSSAPSKSSSASGAAASSRAISKTKLGTIPEEDVAHSAIDDGGWSVTASSAAASNSGAAASSSSGVAAFGSSVVVSNRFGYSQYPNGDDYDDNDDLEYGAQRSHMPENNGSSYPSSS